ncbi:MAG: NAD(P)/FAD-dependent oxidoreductase, partial [Bacteroidota bacterium]
AARSHGSDFAYGVEVVSIDKSGEGYLVGVRDRDGSRFQFETRILINSAGLGSGIISALAGIDIDAASYRIFYKKGIYYRVMRKLDQYPKMLIYPVPPEPGSVGIHTTPDLAGGMRLGPYDYWVDEIDYSVGDERRQLFYDSCKSFLPYLEIDDIRPEGSGIHPKVQKPGEPMRDFVIRHEVERGLDNFINLVGIESPGLTSSAAIGEMVGGMVSEIY